MYEAVLCHRPHIEQCPMTHQWARRCFFSVYVSALDVFFAWTSGRGKTCTAPSLSTMGRRRARSPAAETEVLDLQNGYVSFEG